MAYYSAPFANHEADNQPEWHLTQPRWHLSKKFGRSLSDVTLDGASFHSSYAAYNSSRSEMPRRVSDRLSMQNSGKTGNKPWDREWQNRQRQAFSRTLGSLGSQKVPAGDTVASVFRDRDQHRREWRDDWGLRPELEDAAAPSDRAPSSRSHGSSSQLGSRASLRSQPALAGMSDPSSRSSRLVTPMSAGTGRSRRRVQALP